LEPDDGPTLVRIEKIAKKLDLSTPSIRRGIESGTIRGTRVGKIYLVPADEPERLRALAEQNLLRHRKELSTTTA
jgi:excisionase family DNA binding protein